MAQQLKEGQIINRPLQIKMGRTLATPRVRPLHSQPVVTDRRSALANLAMGSLATSLSSSTQICRTIKARSMYLPIILQELTLCMLDLMPIILSTSTIQTCWMRCLQRTTKQEATSTSTSPTGRWPIRLTPKICERVLNLQWLTLPRTPRSCNKTPS